MLRRLHAAGFLRLSLLGCAVIIVGAPALPGRHCPMLSRRRRDASEADLTIMNPPTTLSIGRHRSFATTFGQLARGGSRNEVYLGFNISRKY